MSYINPSMEFECTNVDMDGLQDLLLGIDYEVTKFHYIIIGTLHGYPRFWVITMTLRLYVTY